jgi:glutamate-1-semialdehyde 2,1-aminomutase
VIRENGLYAVIPTQGPLLGLFLAPSEVAAPSNFDEAKVLCDNGLYRKFFHEMLTRGIAMAPGSYEIMFVSMAHGTREFDRTLQAAAESARAIA